MLSRGHEGPARTVPWYLVIGSRRVERDEGNWCFGPIVNVLQGFDRIRVHDWRGVVQAVRQQEIQIRLPFIIHVVPTAAKGRGKDLVLDQRLGEREIKIRAALVKRVRLVPVINAVPIVIAPEKGVIMN